MLIWRSLIFFLAILSSRGASGTSVQTTEAAVRSAVEAFVLKETRGLPGQVSVTVLPATARVPAPCASFDIRFYPDNAKRYGRVTTHARCTEPGVNWTLSIPVKISLQGTYIVPVRPIAGGETISESDLRLIDGEVTDLPSGFLTSINQATGKVARSALASGRPVRADMLRGAFVILAGQTVRVISRGSGFEVTNEGKAVSSAAPGQTLQVRMTNGQLISGIASPEGIVEVRF